MFIVTLGIFYQNIIFYCSHYLFEKLSITLGITTIISILSFANVLNGGIDGLNNIKYISQSYYLLNILSINAQNIYNYPSKNEYYQYKYYGFSENINNYILYSVLFILGVMVLFFLPKKSNIFFS
jgi:hypothetical protein